MLEPNSELGPYRLLERTGQQGRVAIWTAQAPDGEVVELRAQLVRRGQTERLRAKVDGDLQRAQHLSHPNLARLWDAGVERGWYWIVREPVDGVFLADIVACGLRPPCSVAAQVVEQAARGVAFLHAAPGFDGQPWGALETELTPERLIVTWEGIVKVAVPVTSEAAQDLVESAGRTPCRAVAYLSPEAAADGAQDARSDVFTLGVILWELLAGRPMFEGASDLVLLHRVRRANVPTLSGRVPPALRAEIARSLRRAPADRHPSAEAFARALAEVTRYDPHASPAGIRRWLTAALAVPEPARTELISDEEQCPGGPRLPAAPRRTGRAPLTRPRRIGPPPVPFQTGQRLAPARSSKRPDDPFFDATRDGGGIHHPRFEVLGRLGTGGMGEVYRVRDRELDEVVALKRIPPHAEDGLRAVDRLKREVRLARRIASEYVCRIYDLVDLGAGDRGLTMELVEGETLSDLMQTPMAPDYRRFARWAADLCEGLAAAHAVDVIHRDLKPENVMVRRADDRAVILDFGIARPTLDTELADARLTQAGIIMGTPLYMAPEQLANRPLDGRADLYAVGLILAELITGEVPLGGERYARILERRAVRQELFFVRDKDPAVPALLASVIDRLLLPAAEARFGSAEEVAGLLRAFVAGKISSRHDIPPPLARDDSRPSLSHELEEDPTPRGHPTETSSVPVHASDARRRIPLTFVLVLTIAALGGILWNRWISDFESTTGDETPAERALPPSRTLPADAPLPAGPGSLRAPDTTATDGGPRIRRRAPSRRTLPPVEEM